MNKFPLAGVIILSAACLLQAAANAVDDVGATATGSDEASASLAEIVVTAQKRSESVNDVPLTVTALSGDQLKMAGITDPTDLVKVTPSLVVSSSAWGTPVYTLRGVGYYDNSLSAVPAVTVYVDEVPLPYSKMAGFAALDVERVEVVKGPQGTLYGENSTGGAINFIANKPTDTFHAGGDISYGRFNDAILDAFVSGPLLDTLTARLALHHESAFDGWQHSLTRPGDTLGKKDISSARLLLEWKPVSDLRVLFNVNGGLDRSQTQAAQFMTINPYNAFAYATAAKYNPQFLTYPSFSNHAQNADWDATDPFGPYAKDDKQYQAAITVNYDPSNALGITSISSFNRYNPDSNVDADGTDLPDLQIDDYGVMYSAYQEIRLHGTAFDQLRWIAGANYEHDDVVENAEAYIPATYVGAVDGIDKNTAYTDLRTTSESGYLSADYTLSNGITFTGGTRYSAEDFHFTGCTLADDASTSAIFSIIDNAPVPVGTCFTLDPDGKPGYYSPSNSENNVSWRAGINDKLNSDTLLYVSVSKGYKSGTYPNVNASTYYQEAFVKQESLIDYEGGLKASLFEKKLQVNVAGFYYDYSNKQVLGTLYVPALNISVPALVNVPKSRVVGGEFQAILTPISGLTLDAEATYAASRITTPFTNLDIVGVTKNFEGESLPDAPKWSALARADYKWPLNSTLDAYVGGLLRYQSKSNAALGAEPLADIDSYATLDLQAGVAMNQWRIGIWGRNVTNKYYWNNVYLPLDTITRYAAMPVTYGVSASYRY